VAATRRYRSSICYTETAETRENAT